MHGTDRSKNSDSATRCNRKTRFLEFFFYFPPPTLALFMAPKMQTNWKWNRNFSSTSVLQPYPYSNDAKELEENYFLKRKALKVQDDQADKLTKRLLVRRLYSTTTEVNHRLWSDHRQDSLRYRKSFSKTLKGPL